jgi:cation diffusion facilitator family transporter
MEPKEGLLHADPYEEETRQVQRLALWALLLNLGLAAMKAGLAFYSGSLAVTATAIDSGTDTVASIAVYSGLRLSMRKSPQFPLGLYKIENLISILIAIFIFITGYEILRHALKTPARPPVISIWVIVFLAMGVLGTFLFGRYALRIGRRTESPTLLAEGQHRQTDFLSSIPVLASAILDYLQVPVHLGGVTVDRLAAVLVLVFIVRTGWQLLAGGMRVLLDASMDYRELHQIRSIFESHPLVVQVRSLVGRNAGRFRFVQANVELRTEDLQKGHRASEEIEAEIHRQIPRVVKVAIQYEPRRSSVLRVAIPLADEEGRLNERYGEAPFFGVVSFRREGNQMMERRILENPYWRGGKGKGIQVAQWLVKNKIDEVILKEDIRGKGPGYVLADAGVRVEVVPGEVGDMGAVIERKKLHLFPDEDPREDM